MGLTVGPAAPGDRLVLPETHGGGRSIKRLCMDRRISLSERDRLPAVYAGGCLAAVWRLGVIWRLQHRRGSLPVIQIPKRQRREI